MGPSSIKLGQTYLTGNYNWTQCASDGENTFIPRSVINEEILKTHFIPSNHTESHAKYGTRKYYNLVVDLGGNGKEKTKIIKNAAWYYDGATAGQLKDMIAFRITRRGDPGNPHHDLWAEPESDGVTEVQDWFG